MSEHISTEEAEALCDSLTGLAATLNERDWPEYEEVSAAAIALRALAAERDALREAMETATDCCARATACGRILRDALGENQP